MKLFFTRQLKKLTDRNEIAIAIIDLDHERKRVKLKANELRCNQKPSLTIEDNLKCLTRELNALNIIRGQYLTKMAEIKAQEKINNRLSTNSNVYAETFLQVATGVLNKQTFNKIQAMTLNKLGDKSPATKKPGQTES